jgi:hypothetical protein
LLSSFTPFENVLIIVDLEKRTCIFGIVDERLVSLGAEAQCIDGISENFSNNYYSYAPSAALFAACKQRQELRGL